MAGFLLDTNHLGAAIRPVSPIRDRLRAALRRGQRIGTCVPVLCGLEVGLLQYGDPDDLRRSLRQLMTWVRIWPVEHAIVRFYAEIYMELRRAGRVLSQVDMLLAAMARSGKRTILTADRDFEALPDLRVENWIQ